MTALSKRSAALGFLATWPRRHFSDQGAALIRLRHRPPQALCLHRPAISGQWPMANPSSPNHSRAASSTRDSVNEGMIRSMPRHRLTVGLRLFHLHVTAEKFARHFPRILGKDRPHLTEAEDRFPRAHRLASCCGNSACTRHGMSCSIRKSSRQGCWQLTNTPTFTNSPVSG